LIASAYQFAFAGGSFSERPQLGLTAGYGFHSSNTAGGDQNGGHAGILPYASSSGSGESVGTALAIGSNVGALAIGAAEAFPEQFPALSGAEQGLKNARLVVERDELQPGMSCRVHFEVLSDADGKWYSVTDSPDTKIETDAPEGLLVKQDGSAHTFCVPVTAPHLAADRKVSFTATYTPAGSEALVARSTVTLRAGEVAP
jgi:hypothetical protein